MSQSIEGEVEGEGVVMLYKTLVEAIYDRYNEMLDDFAFTPSSPECETSSMPSSFDNKKDNTENTLCSFYIPAQSPRKTQSGMVITSCSLIMSDQNIQTIGDIESLKRSCKNVIELDLAKNEINSWEEVKKLLNALKNLRLLNLSHNNNLANDITQCKRYFSEWPEIKQLKILILNSCYINLNDLQYLLLKLINLTELHLCSNNYDVINFDDDFRKESLKILYLNNNRLNNWLEVCKLGECFPMLETLVISDNTCLSNFNDSHEYHHQQHHQNHFHSNKKNEFYTCNSFSNLQQLIINKVSINEWSNIDQLRKFPSLKHVRIQNVPLLESYSDEEKYYLLVGHLDGPTTLNGSEITEKEKETCERKLIRYFMDKLNKPQRYFELENRHGKLNKLADINLEANNRVYVKIKFEEKQIFETIDVRLTVAEFKKKLEKFVGYSSNKFRIYYIDVEAMDMLGPEEMKHPNRCLHSFNIRDGDEFEIDLKQPIQQHNSNSTTTATKTTTTTTTSPTSQPTNKTITATRPIIKTASANINCKTTTRKKSSSSSSSLSNQTRNKTESESEAEHNNHPMTPSPTPPSTPQQQEA